MVAVAMIAAGLGLGIKAWDGLEMTNLLIAHLVLGFIGVGLAALQVTALVYRPHLDAPLRCGTATADMHQIVHCRVHPLLCQKFSFMGGPLHRQPVAVMPRQATTVGWQGMKCIRGSETMDRRCN